MLVFSLPKQRVHIFYRFCLCLLLLGQTIVTSTSVKVYAQSQTTTSQPLNTNQNASPIQIIALVIDGSDSIDANDFNLQKEGLQRTLQDPLLVPRDGSIAVMVVQYAETTTQLEVPFRLLDSSTAANQAIDQIGAIVQIQGLTNPGDGINRAVSELQIHGTAADQTTICLSTDGLPNSGSDVAQALTDARAAPVPLDTYSVIAIEDPPSYFAADFHNFYDPLVFGDGAVSVVQNSLEFASFVGATCFAHRPVELVGLESVQTIQDLQDSVPMIANKSTYVRTYIQPVDANPVTVAARLRGWRDGVELPGSPLVAINTAGVVVARPDALTRRNQFEQSLNFLLPATWLNGTIDLAVERVGRPFTCRDVADNPNDCRVTLSFTPVAHPQIRLVGVSWTDPINGTYEPSDAALQELADRFKAIYPIDNLDWDTARTAFNGPLPINTTSLSALNMQLATMRYNDCLAIPNCQRLYYGVLRNTLASGLASGSVASGNMPSSPLGFGRNRHAHEISHLLGINNAVDSSRGLIVVNGVTKKQGWCGEYDSTAAPDFPYFAPINGVTFATLGPMNAGEYAKIFGLDTLRMAAIDPSENYELMSYCGRGALDHFRWISKSTYDRLATAVNERFGAVKVEATAMAEQPQSYRLFRGIVHFATNQIEFFPTLTVESALPPAQPPIGDYTLVLRDQSGNFLTLLPFEPEHNHADFPQPEEETGIFILPVPNTPTIAQVEVMNQDQFLNKLVASSHAPTVQVIFPNGGENLTSDTVTLQWQGGDVDGDSLTYLVEYSRDQGATWQTLVADSPYTNYTVNLSELGETTQGLIRVLVSDGFHSASDTSDGVFSAPNHPPVVTIATPLDHNQYSGVQTILFEGGAIDVEDGQLDPTTFVWSSNLDGVLGTGNQLLREASTLSIGEHQITLMASDSSSASSTASVNIVIYRVPPPPPATLIITPGVTSLIVNSNSRATIQVLVKDVNDTPIPGYRVAFYTTRGEIESMALTDEIGVALANLTADTTPGTATVTVNVGALSSNFEVAFVTGPPAELQLSSPSIYLPADGSSSMEITATLKDAFNNLLANQPVDFATTLGTITTPALTDATGVATATLHASNNVGNAIITANTETASGTTTVTFGVSAINGVVFADLNRNGQRDTGEVGIADAQVTLTSSAGNDNQTTLTLSDGSYTFVNLVGGDYQVTLTLPPAYTMTTARSFTFTANPNNVHVPDTGAVTLLFLPGMLRQSSGND